MIALRNPLYPNLEAVVDNRSVAAGCRFALVALHSGFHQSAADTAEM
jgi:hypothetical protein